MKTAGDKVLDVPIVRAGVVEGRVTRGGRGVGGVTVALTPTP